MKTIENFHFVLVQELKVSCDMIKLAIENMDETIWNEKENDWSYVQTLYHIIETIEFYSFDEPKNLAEQGGLGIHAPKASKEELNILINEKSKDFFLEYLEKVRDLSLNRIKKFSVEELFSKDKFSEWGFSSRFHKISYTLRHTMMHIGELNKNLRDLNMTRVKWL